ncbi:hypothetical protein [Holdemanella sp.]|uniref:hypothetical protein n=1 Tax=Holdemanella sp. TaxID=1971762 RepID=UPI003AF01F60
MPVSTNSTKKASSSSRSRTKQAELDVAEFANNPHQTEYTLMMHKYADLDKRERSLKIKQRLANWMLFASVILTIGCLIATAYVCNVIQSIRF